MRELYLEFVKVAGNMTDPIADMFSRIKNAQMAKLQVVLVPHSKIKMEIARLLQNRGFVKEVIRRGKKNRRMIELALYYDASKKGKITDLKRISKPSRRLYRSYKDIRLSKKGYGCYIVSTSKGIMDGTQARKLKVGGEILGEVY